MRTATASSMSSGTERRRPIAVRMAVVYALVWSTPGSRFGV
jgi:hypothetical protein